MKFLTWVALAMLSCSAVASTLPAPIQALQRQGIIIRGDMQAPAGFRGYLAEYGGSRMPVYLLPDGKHVVIGNLFDAQGNDMTRDAFMRAARPKLDAATWKALEKSTWIPEGASKPKRIVYVFDDTECPYCHRLWERVQPMLAGGDVQVRYIMVAVIRPESLGRAAAVLSATDPSAVLRTHEAHFGNSPIKPLTKIPASVRAKIEANNALMARLGATGTPAIVYRDGKGAIRMVDGMPSDPAQIRAIFGS